MKQPSLPFKRYTKDKPTQTQIRFAANESRPAMDGDTCRLCEGEGGDCPWCLGASVIRMPRD